MTRILASTLCSLLVAAALPFGIASAAEDETTTDTPADPTSTEGSTAVQIGAVDVDAYPEVSFTLNVLSTADGPLPPGAISVFEDGDPRTADVRYADTADLQVVLLMDTTGSMEPSLSGAQDAAVSFLGQLPDDVGVAVVAYATEAAVITDFSADRDEHVAGIDGLTAAGYTATYDAVATAVGLFPPAEPDTSRVVVLLTDGEDNRSESTVDDAITALTDAAVTLHGIEYRTAFTEEAAIRDMAGATGGEIMEADDPEALTRVYEGLAADLTSRYEVRYDSQGHGPTELEVRLDHESLSAVASLTLDLPAAPDQTPDAEVEDPPAVAPAGTPPAVTPPSGAEGAGRGRLIGGALLWFAAIGLMVGLAMAPRRRTQLSGAAARLGVGQRRATDTANRISRLVDDGLARRGLLERLNSALERAGIELRPGEYVVLVGSAAVALFALGWLASGWPVAVLLAVMAVVVGRMVVSVLTRRRQAAFATQLAETLQLLSGSLRSGYSLMQAVDAVAREADAPAAREFGRLVVETRLGRDMATALRAMADRMCSEDFDWVVQAIEINREVGGDLAEVLDTVARTIRERDQIRRQIRALSAEGRLSAYILLALPFGVGFLLWLTNPSYIGELIHGGVLGWALISFALLLMSLGTVWMHKLIKLEF